MRLCAWTARRGRSAGTARKGGCVSSLLISLRSQADTSSERVRLMKVLDARSVGPAFVPNLWRANGPSGRLTVPVSPAHVVYAHLKHVAGVPAGDRQGEVSMYRLRMIDTLVGRLTASSAAEGYERRVRASRSQDAVPPTGPGSVTGEAGRLVNLLA